MEREPRRKSVAYRRPKRCGGSSNNPSQQEERLVRPFSPTIRFGHEGQRNKFKQLMARKFVPIKYLSASTLQRSRLLDEVNMYVARMGWEAFIMMKHPTYIVPTCEFLSSLHFDENEAILSFRLSN